MSFAPTPALPGGSTSVSAAELRRNFGVWQERAMSQPVVVLRHGKPRLVLATADRFFATREPAVEAAPESVLQDAYGAIPEHSSEGLIVLDHDLGILAVNRVFEDMAGRHASRMVGRNWLEQFPETADSVVVAHFRHVLRTGAAVQFEAPSVLVAARRYVFTVFPHAGGLGALIVNRTNELMMTDEIEEHRSLVAAFAATPGTGYLKVNLRGLICAASEQFRLVLGFAPGAGSHPALCEIAAPQDRARLLEAIDGVLSGGPAQRLSLSLLKVDGDLITVDLALAALWRGPTVDGAMAFFRAVVV